MCGQSFPRDGPRFRGSRPVLLNHCVFCAKKETVLADEMIRTRLFRPNPARIPSCLGKVNHGAFLFPNLESPTVGRKPVECRSGLGCGWLLRIRPLGPAGFHQLCTHVAGWRVQEITDRVGSQIDVWRRVAIRMADFGGYQFPCPEEVVSDRALGLVLRHAAGLRIGRGGEPKQKDSENQAAQDQPPKSATDCTRGRAGATASPLLLQHELRE